MSQFGERVARLAMQAVGFGLVALSAATAIGAMKIEPILPFELSKHSVVQKGILRVGDLSILKDDEAAKLKETRKHDPIYLADCARPVSNAVRLAADGKHLELHSGWGSPATDSIQTEYCEEGVVMLGGATRAAGSKDGPALAWILFWDPRLTSLFKLTPTDPIAVGEWPKEKKYTLEEVRFIDPDQRRIVFLGRSRDGKEALLAAPFAIVQPDGSAR